MTSGRRARAALYVRVSTREQAQTGYSIEDQQESLRLLAQRRGCVSEVLYCDAGISGEKLEGRPGLTALLLAAEEGRLDEVLVVDESRLARDELVGALIRDKLKRGGVRLVTTSGERDLTDPSDNFVANVLSAAAAFEQDLRTKKTLSGKRRAALANNWPAGPPPFGYRLVEHEGHSGR